MTGTDLPGGPLIPLIVLAVLLTWRMLRRNHQGTDRHICAHDEETS